MDELICEGCDSRTRRLRYCGGNGWLCECCQANYGVAPKALRPAYFNQSAGNKHAPKMTELEKRHITTRRRHPDGIVRSHPKYETKEY